MTSGFAAAWSHWALSWRRSVGVRLLSVLFCISCVLSSLASGYDYFIEKAAAMEALRGFGRSLARQGALACPDAVTIGDGPTLEAYVDALVAEDKLVSFAAVRRDDGAVLACNPRSGIPEADDSSMCFEDAVRTERGGEKLGTFVLGLSFRPMQAAMRAKLTGLLVRATLGFVFMAVLFWMALGSLVLRPLRQLDAAAQRLGQAQFEAPMPMLGENELGRLGQTMDTMRKNLLANQQSLAAQNHKLVELNRLKSHFLTNVSHEMRTPLTSILGGIEALVGDEMPKAERHEAAEAMQRNGEMLLDLVDRVLDLAKIENGSLLIEIEPCRPDTILAEVCKRSASEALCKGLVMRCDASSIAGKVMKTDPTRLRQMVAALVSNSVKFSYSGKVEVRAAIESGPEGVRLRVEVIDTGIGIPAEFLPHLFEAFSQADGSLTRRHGGAGLGLAVAKRIAQRLGGDLEVTSENGKGTHVTATISVELVDATLSEKSAASASAGAVGAPAPAAPSLTGRVLVVDDAIDNQRLLKAMMTKAGLEVDIADNGRLGVEAVKKAQTDRQYSLVIMDLQMPVLDGVSAIRELREQGFTMPIVALTAHAIAEDRERSLAAGATQYETKPISRKRLLEVVAAHLTPQTA